MAKITRSASLGIPSLFGLNQSNANKDFTQAEAWGKNSFNED